MSIELADLSERIGLTKESQDIWSGGMSLSDRLQFMSRQMTHPWAKRNIKRYVLRQKGAIGSSCKLYNVDFTFRGQVLSLYGLGGIYTPKQMRGHGFASRLVNGIVDIAKQNNADGVLLFSDIGTEFYEALGFEQLGGDNFEIDLSKGSPDSNPTGHTTCVRKLTVADIPIISRHYQRWLRRQHFGRDRSESYWSFRLWSEEQFQIFSHWDWPVQELVTFTSESGIQDSGLQAYSIIECAGKNMRVLETIGPEALDQLVWEELIRLANGRSLERIHGWEATSPKSLPYSKMWVEREWAIPMFLSLSKQTHSWLDADNCPLLELDSF